MTILHIIESLDVGGAEMLLTESLRHMPSHYRHVVVYLRKPGTLVDQVHASSVYFLDVQNKLGWLGAIAQLRRIIKREGIELIHAHLFWPTVPARLAKPRKIPLVFTVHSCLGKSLFSKNGIYRYLESYTYRADQHAVFVSGAVIEDYSRYINVKGKSSILHNFVADRFYQAGVHRRTTSQDELRLVAVGNLRPEKNYPYLLKAFTLLKDYPIYLDIYGIGPEFELLRSMIYKYNLGKVTLKGRTKAVADALVAYDVYILASHSEGFGIATAEVMAAGLPCMLSDIEVNREIAGSAASYFDLQDPKNCADKLVGQLKDRSRLSEMADKSRAKAEAYRVNHYIHTLDSLYKTYREK